MKFLLSSAAVLIFAAAAFAGSTSGGTILGKLVVASGQISAVSGKSVRLVAASGGNAIAVTRTDASGGFLFRGVPAGIYRIYVDCSYCVGGEVLQANVAVTDEAETPVTIEMPLSGISEVVNIAAGVDQEPKAVAKTVSTIDGQEMRDRADFTLVDSLRTVPGLRVEQQGGFGRVATIKTRGLRNQDTAILIDGVRFRDPTAITGDASPFLSDLTLTSVREVEVLRGSGSSLYGTNAIGGVINFETPTARGGTHGQLSGAAGGLGLGRFRANLSHGTKDNKFGIGGGFSRTAYTKGIDGDDNADNTNLQLRSDLAPWPTTSFTASIFYTNAKVRLNTSPDTLGILPTSVTTIVTAREGVNFIADQDDPDARQRSRSFSGKFGFTHSFSSKFGVSGYYHSLLTRRRNDDGILGPGYQSPNTSVYDGRIDTLHGDLNWSASEKDQLNAAYEYERERYGNEGLTPTGTQDFFTRATQASHSFAAQEMLRLLGGRLQLVGAFRVQAFRLSEPTFSLANAPYSGLTQVRPPAAYTFDGAAAYYVASTGTKFRAHIGNGYRVPSLYERFGTFYSTFPTPDFVALGDPGLKPERSIAADAGIDQDLLHKRASASVTYFWTKLTDIIGFGNVVSDIGPTTRPFGGYENQNGGRSQGVETSFRIRPVRTTDISTSYTYTDSKQNVSPVAGSGILRTFGVPKHQFTLVATQRFRGFWVNFDLLVTSDYLAPVFSNSTFSTYVYRFTGNRKGDLTAGYVFKLPGREGLNLRLYGTIENVFDQEYFANGFRTSRATGRLGATFSF